MDNVTAGVFAFLACGALYFLFGIAKGLDRANRRLDEIAARLSDKNPD
jgi:hypothetical protein